MAEDFRSLELASSNLIFTPKNHKKFAYFENPYYTEEMSISLYTLLHFSSTLLMITFSRSFRAFSLENSDFCAL